MGTRGPGNSLAKYPRFGCMLCERNANIQFGMVLTPSQKNQLHKDLLEYFVNNDLPKTAQALAEEVQLSVEGVDPDGKKLEIKWKSILSLQKKINILEDKVQGLEEDLSKCSNGKGLDKVKLEDMFMPQAKPKFEMKGHKSPITSMAFHPQFTELATSSEDGTAKLWEVESGDFLRTLKGHTNPVTCVNYDQQGKYIVTSSSDLTIKLWDCTNDYQCCKTFYGHEHNVSHVGFVMNGDYLLSCSRDKTIRLWEVSTGYCKKTYNGHEGWVRKVVASEDSKTFASCSDDMSVIIWNIDKEAPVNRFFAHENVIENILLIEGEKGQVLMHADFLKHKFTQETKIAAIKKLEQEGSNGISSYQQMFVLTASRDKLVRLFAAHSGELLHTFVGHDNWVKGLALHPTGKYLYTCSDDKSLRVWDLNYGKQKKRIDAHEHFVATVCFHKKYGIIGTAGSDTIVKIWHLK